MVSFLTSHLSYVETSGISIVLINLNEKWELFDFKWEINLSNFRFRPIHCSNTQNVFCLWRPALPSLLASFLFVCCWLLTAAAHTRLCSVQSRESAESRNSQLLARTVLCYSRLVILQKQKPSLISDPRPSVNREHGCRRTDGDWGRCDDPQHRPGDTAKVGPCHIFHPYCEYVTVTSRCTCTPQTHDDWTDHVFSFKRMFQRGGVYFYVCDFHIYKVQKIHSNSLPFEDKIFCKCWYVRLFSRGFSCATKLFDHQDRPPQS